jgi:methyl-accepting chemotaxis protein
MKTFMQFLQKLFAHRSGSVVLALTAGLVLSAGLYWYDSNVQEKSLSASFARLSLVRALAFKYELQNELEPASTLNAFYAASNSVSRDEFETFTGTIFERTTSIHWIAWAPRASGPQADPSEKSKSSQETAGGFRAADVDKDAAAKSAGQEGKFPLQYLSYAKAFRGNDKLLGLDIASTPAWKEALERARDSGKRSVAPAGSVANFLGEPSTLLVFQPIYRNGSTVMTPEERQKYLMGYAVLLIDTHLVMDSALKDATKAGGGVNLAVLVGQDKAKLAEIFAHTSRTLQAGDKPVTAQRSAAFQNDLEFQRAGAEWVVRSTPAPGFFREREGNQPLIVLGVSLLFTLLVTIYVNALARTRVREQEENIRKQLEAEKKQKENEELNDSIIDIMRTVAKTAQGDLTIQAPVREDITGALSDAINSMSESTARTLANVANVSNEVRSASQEGRNTVLLTSRGMSDIRGTIQETGKRIKRLGERSQEITSIVKLIDDIAERTSVLALNANMQAAMAGEAGRGFRVVADEVQRLAERSKEATEQIGKLVGTIQSETNDTMLTMDRAIGEVVKGGELADKAAAQVTLLDELGGTLLESVQAFKLPSGLVHEAASTRDGRDSRRVA